MGGAGDNCCGTGCKEGKSSSKLDRLLNILKENLKWNNDEYIIKVTHFHNLIFKGRLKMTNRKCKNYTPVKPGVFACLQGGIKFYTSWEDLF